MYNIETGVVDFYEHPNLIWSLIFEKQEGFIKDGFRPAVAKRQVVLFLEGKAQRQGGRH
jgi:hypothetical protein